MEQFLYSRRSGERFMLLFGEPGAGKSVAISTMVAALEPETPAAVVRHPTLGPRELLEEIGRRFGLPAGEDRSKSSLLARMEELFRRSVAQSRRPLLVLDEAQLLSPAGLEEVRLLTNLEHDHAPMLQVILAGQPKIVERLKSPRLKQLRQRISIQVQIRPLTWTETRDYVRHSLRQAGCERPELVFPDATVTALHGLTAGLPREINIAARQSMIGAYLAERGTVLPEDVSSVPREFGFESVASPASLALSAPETPASEPQWSPTDIDADEPGVLLADIDESGESALGFPEAESRPIHESARETRRFASVFGAVVALAACALVLAHFFHDPPSPGAVEPPSMSGGGPPESGAPALPSEDGDSDVVSGVPPPNSPAPEPRPEPVAAPPAEEVRVPRASSVDAATARAGTEPRATTTVPAAARRPAPSGAADALDRTRAAAELEAVNLLERGAELAERGRMDEAIVYFRRVVEIRPDDFAGRYNLGTALLAAGAAGEAAEELRRAVSSSPENVEAVRNLGRALLRSGAREEAVGFLERAAALTPDDASGHELLGMAFIELGRLEEAIEIYREAVSLAAGDGAAHERLGIALRKAGRDPEAVEAFRQSVAIAPESARAHEYLGMSLLDVGDLDGAVDAFRRSAELSPDDARLHHNLGYALRRNAQLEESIEAFRRATEIDPEFALAYYSQALALLEAGQKAEAARSMLRATHLGFEPPPQ